MRIQMQNICKSFGLNEVLKNVELDLREGEVLSLIGENGAGKSTLMKILTGIHTKDSGKIFVNGVEVTYQNPKEAEKNGISFIYQELNIVQGMTVEANLFLNKEIKTFGICNSKEMRKQGQAALDNLGVDISVDELMSNLSVGQQQMVEICKALMADAEVIIMDEPTSALTDVETRTLFRVITDLKAKGVSIIYISHRMEEIFEICDRITVLRDGEYIGTKDISDTSMEELIQMMIGRELTDRFPRREVELGDVVFSVKNLSSPNAFTDVSFSIKEGEVLGVSGLMGAGRTEVMETLFGYRPHSEGEIYFKGEKIQIRKPMDAMNYDIGFITEDRKNEGLMLNKSIRENISLTNLNKISKNGLVNKSKEFSLIDEGIDKLNVVCFSRESIAQELSGGNQQKVVLAKWIMRRPKVLILDEPTRGVDVGAKEEIYHIINELAEQGVAIIMVSSELPELLGMADRIIVLHEGKQTGEVTREQATQENIMRLATGGILE